jgi:hypothetical protein
MGKSLKYHAQKEKKNNVAKIGVISDHFYANVFWLTNLNSCRK